VMALAGFITTEQHKTVTFAIIQNNIRSQESALDIEAKLLNFFYRR
jgi:D-alanyl-D-alanine carboxypeptidase